MFENRIQHRKNRVPVSVERNRRPAFAPARVEKREIKLVVRCVQFHEEIEDPSKKTGIKSVGKKL